jgi:hypothetical protein
MDYCAYRPGGDLSQNGAHGPSEPEAASPLRAGRQNGVGARRSTFEIEPILASEDDEGQPHKLGETAALLAGDYEDSVDFRCAT